MKVGTDGVLLGAWAALHESTNLLDIGTGSGLIALMLAQRNAQAHVTGIELDEAAAADPAERSRLALCLAGKHRMWQRTHLSR